MLLVTDRQTDRQTHTHRVGDRDRETRNRCWNAREGEKYGIS